jgi:hypothetical protein
MYMSRYKGRTVRLYPFVVEVMVPEGGLGRRLDDMHAFHRQRGIITAPRAVATVSTIISAGALRTLPPLKRLRRSFPAV